MRTLIIFSWIWPIYSIGHKKTLAFEDLYCCSKKDVAHRVADRLEKYFMLTWFWFLFLIFFQLKKLEHWGEKAKAFFCSCTSQDISTRVCAIFDFVCLLGMWGSCRSAFVSRSGAEVFREYGRWWSYQRCCYLVCLWHCGMFHCVRQFVSHFRCLCAKNWIENENCQHHLDLSEINQIEQICIGKNSSGTNHQYSLKWHQQIWWGKWQQQNNCLF